MMLVEEPVPIGGDLSYGPAMFIDADQVKAIAGQLERADDATVAAHWSALDSPFMQDFYDDDEGKDFAMYGYRKTVDVFVAAAAAGQGVLFAIL